MRCIAIFGSPRIRGNTYQLVKKVAEILVSKGYKIEYVYLNDIKGKPCKDCGGCRKIDRCIYVDYYTEVINRIIASDMIIIGTPVYFGAVTTQLKILVDRMQVVYNNRNLVNADKRLLCISVAAENQSKVFEGIKQCIGYINYIFKVKKSEYILVNGIQNITKIENMIDESVLYEKVQTLIN